MDLVGDSLFCIQQIIVKFDSAHNTLGMGFPGGSDGKASFHNAEDRGSIPGSGRSPGEGTGYPLQYSCLENPMDGGAWWAIVLGITNSWK